MPEPTTHSRQIAFQDRYDETHSHCFGCGRNNPHGHHLKSFWSGAITTARFRPAAQYTGGVPSHVYGGLIASLFDCHGTASAAAFNHREHGHELNDPAPFERCVTASLNVDFLRPTPMGVELLVEGVLDRLEGRKVWVEMSLKAEGTLCARARMLAIVLRPDSP
ncbi:MAG: PaaI family thioesterase [Gammaproteobacteria bacterium]